jgi:hypothetical protein
MIQTDGGIRRSRMHLKDDLLRGSGKGTRWVVPICGGLGAQIFGVMLVEHLRRTHTPEAVFADSSYFAQQHRRASRGEGVSVFAWELDYYGLPRDRYVSNPPRAPMRLIRGLGLSNVMRLEEGSLARQRLVRAALESRPDWPEVFPVSPEHRLMAEEMLASDEAATAVVHLRRGDYLNVASHVVSDEAVLPVVAKLNRHGVRRFLFLSDGEIDLDLFRRHLETGTKVAVLPPGDSVGGHAVMRLAKWLITSNSQFSLSAALLNRSGLCLMPRTWYAGKTAQLHPELARLSDWSLIGWLS